jgi:diguanylate cyclase (GGDEF)-like protein/PAS domain S-box-containing protein
MKANLSFSEVEQLRQRIVELEAENKKLKKENALVDNEKNLRTFFDTIDHLLFVLDAQGNILSINKTVVRKLGYSARELVGQSVLAIHPPERREEAGRIVSEMLAGRADYCPVPVMTRDGRQIPVETRVVAGKWSGQDAIFGVTKDLSEIKASEEKFSKAFHASPSLMAISEIATGKYVDVNEAFLRTLAFKREDVIGKTSLEMSLFFDPNQRAAVLERMKHEGSLNNIEVLVRAHDGEIHDGLFSAEYIRLQDRELLLTVMSDITERKNMERALLKSEAQLNLFFSQSLDGFFFMMLDEPVRWDESVDKDKTLDYVFAHQHVTKINDAMLEQYRTTRDQFLGRTPNDFFAHDILQAKRVWRQFFDDGHLRIDTDERRFDGTQMWVEGDYICLYDAEGRISGHFGIQRDITENKNAEEQLRKLSRAVESNPSSIVITNADGDIEYVNPKFTLITGYSMEEACGKNPRILQSGKTPRETYPKLWDTILAGKEWRGEFFNKKKNFELYWESASISPILDAAGAITHFVAVKEDITERKRTETKLRESELRYRTLFEQSPDGIVILDPETTQPLEFNDQVCRQLGYTREEFARLTLKDIEVNESIEDALAHIQNIMRKGRDDFETRHRTKQGEIRDVLVTAQFIEMSGEPIYRCIWRDITESRQSEEALRESELRFRSLFEQTHDAVFILDLNGRHAAVNQRAADMLGYTKDEIAGLSVNETSAEKEQSHDILKRLMAGKHVPLYERRFRHKSGRIIPVEITVELIRDEGGNPLHIQSVVRDISERKQAEERLRASEDRYRIVAETTHDWAFWQAPDDRFIYSSPSCKHVTGHEADEFVQDPELLLNILHPNDRAILLNHQRVIKGSHTADEVEFRILLPDGTERWIDHACQPIFDETGEYLGVRGSNRDITQRKHAELELSRTNAQLQLSMTEIVQLQSELREQAIRDPLTGLYNRRYLDETLGREMARSQREGKSLSVIMMDLDHFKKINDTYGHRVGDQFLKKVAEISVRYSRGSDISCRYGGEEFLLVMPGATAKSAFKRAEELRQACAEMLIPHENKELHVTISMGIATYPKHDKDADGLIAKADKAMYQSKRKGRNRVTVWEE